MDIEKYLSRIDFNGPLEPNLATLKSLHRQHLLHVPFEDLDIHYKRRFDLGKANVYDKVVHQRRGGFCYEINSLFNELLNALGFKTKIISGKVFTDAGLPGPEYDHLALIIRLGDRDYLADVGFGDLFIEPIEVCPVIQFDGRIYFAVEEDGSELCLMMSDNVTHFAKKYTFTTDETPIELFERPCREKQTNPDSHFVKNTICTQLTDQGRITIYNDKFTETIGDQKTQRPILNDDDLRGILKMRFGIQI